MKPCDCKDEMDVQKLYEQGLGFADVNIAVKPLKVILTVGPCRLSIPRSLFRRLAEWYLEDQAPAKG